MKNRRADIGENMCKSVLKLILLNKKIYFNNKDILLHWFIKQNSIIYFSQ